MKKDKVKILILNYNGRAFLNECLDSVMAIDYSNYSVVLIDNNSTDSSVEYVKSKYKDVKIFKTDKNRFYAGGYNYFFDKDSEESFYMILNNDTIVDKNILNDLIAGVNKYGKNNIYGPKIMFAKEKSKIWYAGAKVDLYKGIIRHLNIRKNIHEVNLSDFVPFYNLSINVSDCFCTGVALGSPPKEVALFIASLIVPTPSALYCWLSFVPCCDLGVDFPLSPLAPVFPVLCPVNA